MSISKQDILDLQREVTARKNSKCNGLITLPDSDSDSDSDSCIMQKFHIGSDPDSDPTIEVYGIGTDICPWDGYLSLKWVQ